MRNKVMNYYALGRCVLGCGVVRVPGLFLCVKLRNQISA